MREHRWKILGITAGIAGILVFFAGFFTGVREYEAAEFFFNLFYIAVFVAAIFLDSALAYEFYEVAEKKGYYEGRYYWIPFVFTTIGYLLIIALPDRGAAAKTYAAPKSYAAPKANPTYPYGAPQQPMHGTQQSMYGAPQQPAYSAPQQPVYNDDLPDL